jgi:CheY-like chemotaxis protein
MEPSKSKIFIVEDESIVSFDIECCLKKSGYNVVGTATSHKELLEKIEGARPNLILMDIRIPSVPI